MKGGDILSLSLLSVSSFIADLSPVARTIFSIAIMLIGGYGMTRLTKLLKLPNTTAYLIVGIILASLHLVSDDVITGSQFLPDIALAFISFSTGEYLKLDVLKRSGIKVLIITILESLIASILIFILTYFILRLSLPYALILSSIASSTAAAAIMMIIRQTGSKGDFVNTLLLIIAIDNILALLSYSIMISISSNIIAGTAFSLFFIIKPILINILVLILGGLFGLFLVLLLKKRSQDNRLIISIALLFGFCGICAILDISPLLGCMSMGIVYGNVSKDDKLFKQLNYFSPPILLLFFVRSGLTFDLSALGSSSDTLGPTPLIVVAILYFLIRVIGKYGGAFIGCLITKKEKNIRNYLGLALLPQTSVAIGLAALSQRTLSALGFGEEGIALQSIIVAASFIGEMIGPACAKLSLYLSKSYSNNIEELAPVEEQTPTGEKKNEVDILIDRIKKIQETIPKHDFNEEETAYNEAIEEQNNYYMQYNNRHKNWRRK